MNVLFTAFCKTSAEQLLRENGCAGLFLPNDKIADAKMLIGEISAKKYNYIFSFGQKPNVKDKVYIEKMARNAGECLETDFDCEKLLDSFCRQQTDARISCNAGTSFCNRLYWNVLEHIRKNGLDVKMVFVHIPMRKNITDFGEFGRRVLAAIRNSIL